MLAAPNGMQRQVRDDERIVLMNVHKSIVQTSITLAAFPNPKHQSNR